MQNYLREQPDNIHNINIVGEVANFLQVYYTEVNSETMELVHLILQTLIEMCVGNFPNQEAIFNRQIIDAINGILELRVNVTGNPKETEDVSIITVADPGGFPRFPRKPPLDLRSFFY